MIQWRNEIKQTAKGLAFLSPWLIGFAVFMALPIGLSLYLSFCNYPLLQPPVFVGLRNYHAMLHDSVFWESLRNTGYYALLTLPAGMIIAIAAALLLNSRVRGIAIYRAIIFLPSLVPLVASSMVWLWLFNSRLGLINTCLRYLGILHPPGWLTSPKWAMPSLAIMSFWGLGNTVVIYLAGLQDVPKELYEAAEIDGASPARQLWHVTLPGISPVIFFNLIMAIIGVVQNFTVPYVMTQGGPDRVTYLFTMYLYDNAFSFLHMGYASAMAWVELLMVLVLTAIAFWSSRHWVHYQGK